MSNDNELRWPIAGPLDAAFQQWATEGPTWSGYAGTDLPSRSALERILAAVQGYDHCVAVNSGTDAGGTAVRAALTKRGRAWLMGRTQILTSDVTFFPGTAGGAYEAGLHALRREPEIIAFDARGKVDPTVDERAMIDYVHAHHEQILCVVVPSLLGTWARLDPIISVAGGYDIPVISDECQAVGARRPGEEWPDAAFGSGQGGKGGANGGEIGFAFGNEAMDGYLFRRYTDAGNEPGGNLNPLGSKPEIELLGPALTRRADAFSSATAFAQLVYSLAQRPNIATARAEIRESVAEINDWVGEEVFQMPEMDPAARRDPYSEPIYGDLLVANPAIRSAQQWINVFRENGFGAKGSPYSRYAVRPFYGLGHEHPDWKDRVTLAGPIDNGRWIARNGIVIHVAALPRMAEELAKVAKATL